MKQYKILRNMGGTWEVIGFEYHTEGEICHKKRKVELEKEPRVPGEFPMSEGDIKEEVK